MHLSCSSVAARLHHTRPHMMVAPIRRAKQCPSQLYQRNERTYRCLSQPAGMPDSGATTGTCARTVATASLGLSLMVGLVRTHGQVAPACHSLQTDCDDGPFGDLHRRQLAVPRA